MAKEAIKNEKGFSIIELNITDMLKLGGLGICDRCSHGMFKGTYIGVLDYTYCDGCYDEFQTESKYYPEDSDIEDCNTTRTLTILKGGT